MSLCPQSGLTNSCSDYKCPKCFGKVPPPPLPTPAPFSSNPEDSAALGLRKWQSSSEKAAQEATRRSVLYLLHDMP